MSAYANPALRHQCFLCHGMTPRVKNFLLHFLLHFLLPPSYFLLHFIHISNMSAIADAPEFATIKTYRIRTDTVRITQRHQRISR